MIPAGPEGLTPAWMAAALGADPEELSSLSLTRIGEGIGIMGESYRAVLDWAAGASGHPSSVVVKLPSTAPENRQHAINLGLYDAETRFYRELAPSTVTRTPRCGYVESEPGTANFVLVLEDLTGLRMVDQAQGLGRPEAEAAVLGLADLHASWWGRAEEPAFEWAPSLVHPRIQAMAGMWPGLWPVFAERFAGSLSPDALNVGEIASRRYWAGMRLLAESPWTVLHMDFRCENLLFDDSRSGADHVVVIDWQTLGRGAAAYDLAYLLGGSLDVEDRRAWEEDLVAGYSSRLAAGGVAGYGLDRLWEDYRLAHALAGTSTCVLTGAGMDLGNERGRRLIETMTARHFTAAVDLDSTARLD